MRNSRVLDYTPLGVTASPVVRQTGGFQETKGSQVAQALVGLAASGLNEWDKRKQGAEEVLSEGARTNLDKLLEARPELADQSWDEFRGSDDYLTTVKEGLKGHRYTDQVEQGLAKQFEGLRHKRANERLYESVMGKLYADSVESYEKGESLENVFLAVNRGGSTMGLDDKQNAAVMSGMLQMAGANGDVEGIKALMGRKDLKFSEVRTLQGYLQQAESVREAQEKVRKKAQEKADEMNALAAMAPSMLSTEENLKLVEHRMEQFRQTPNHAQVVQAYAARGFGPEYEPMITEMAVVKQGNHGEPFKPVRTKRVVEAAAGVNSIGVNKPEDVPQAFNMGLGAYVVADSMSLNGGLGLSAQEDARMSLAAGLYKHYQRTGLEPNAAKFKAFQESALLVDPGSRDDVAIPYNERFHVNKLTDGAVAGGYNHLLESMYVAYRNATGSPNEAVVLVKEWKEKNVQERELGGSKVFVPKGVSEEEWKTVESVSNAQADAYKQHTGLSDLKAALVPEQGSPNTYVLVDTRTGLPLLNNNYQFTRLSWERMKHIEKGPTPTLDLRASMPQAMHLKE